MKRVKAVDKPSDEKEPRKVIKDPADIPPEVMRYMSEQYGKYWNTYSKDKIVEVGLNGKSCTEKAPDMPTGRLNYSWDRDGTETHAWNPKEDLGKIVIAYDHWEEGYRSVLDKGYDPLKALKEGRFRLEKSPGDALKMMPLMPLIHKYYFMALDDAERKFDIKLPRYRRIMSFQKKGIIKAAIGGSVITFVATMVLGLALGTWLGALMDYSMTLMILSVISAVAGFTAAYVIMSQTVKQVNETLKFLISKL